jgi:hypothetical protein
MKAREFLEYTDPLVEGLGKDIAKGALRGALVGAGTVIVGKLIRKALGKHKKPPKQYADNIAVQNRYDRGVL